MIVSARYRICNGRSEIANQPPPQQATKTETAKLLRRRKNITVSFFDNLQPVHNIETFVPLNSNHINFLIAVVLTPAKVRLKCPL